MQPLQSVIVTLLLASIEIVGLNIKTSNCGRLLVGHNALVTGGFSTQHWPWHAAVYHRGYKPLPEYKCGGTLINANSILTAAHCVSGSNKPLSPLKVSVSLGRLNLDIYESSAQSFEVTKIFQHPNYSSIDLNNDIAIIKLSTDVTFNNYVRPVCLWNTQKTELSEVVDREGVVVGWGVTDTGETSNILQQAFMPVVSSLKCLASNRVFFGTFLSETNFCAGFRNGTRTCNGDSGGSMTFEENGLFYIRGIVSLGAAIEDEVTGKVSCDSSQFAVFTDVAQYLFWIDEVANNDCEMEVPCSRNYILVDKYPHDYLVCEINLNIRVIDQKCRIIFTEYTNTSIEFLAIRGELEALPDISDAIDKFVNLQVLEVSHSKLKVIERKKFTAFKRIDALRLIDNEITDLASDTFDELKSITELALNNNTLKRIDRDLLQELRTLTQIYLNDNLLETLPEDIFRNNVQLQLISVSDNNIKTFHRDVFKDVSNIFELRFSDNQLETLPEGIFRNNHQLLTILGSDNKIKEIHRDVFKYVRRLAYLSLNDNLLEFLPPDLFQNNQQLAQISIIDNKIKFIHQDLFSEVRDLKWLFLSGNQIEILPENLFRNNRELLQIEISQNLIKELHPDLFINVRSLKWIDLSENQLELLPLGLFRNNGKLKKIIVRANKIKKIESEFYHLANFVVLDLKENDCIDELCNAQTFCDTFSLTLMQEKIWNKC